MTQVNETTYKAVIALNNAAVHLMQRRLFPEGLATMKDALRLMRNAFFSDGSSALQPDEVNQALQAAWRRSSKRRDDAVLDDASNVVMISDIDNPYDVYTTLAQNPGIIHCVRIDAHEDFCGMNTDRLEIESAFMMYNYGIAHLLAYPSNVCQAEQVTTSFQLLHLAAAIVDEHRHGLDLVDAPTNVLLVALLINATLYQLTLQLNMKISHERQNLLELISTIVNREIILPQYKCTAASAA